MPKNEAIPELNIAQGIFNQFTYLASIKNLHLNLKYSSYNI